MRFEASIVVAAKASDIFAVYADVEHWPEWTKSVTSVERLDDGPFGVGSKARVKQPRLPVTEWEVTELEPGQSFTWVAGAPGLQTTGIHRVTPIGADSCRVTATLLQEGPLGHVVGLVSSGLTRRYLQMEVHGIKARGEEL
jgi:uncharacterized membrane protein